MAYSEVGIVNQALIGIGVKPIASLAEESNPAILAKAILPACRDEVLESADWIFAKTRKALARNATDPVQGYSYAYTLPPDFLRICRQRKDDPPVFPDADLNPPLLFVYVQNRPIFVPYIIETLQDDNHTRCIFTNYDNSNIDLVLNYIRREENAALYSAHFVSTLAFRLGASLAVPLTESDKKEDRQWKLYERALKRAAALNNAQDFMQNETGNDDWDRAGR